MKYRVRSTVCVFGLRFAACWGSQEDTRQGQVSPREKDKPAKSLVDNVLLFLISCSSLNLIFVECVANISRNSATLFRVG